MKTDWRSDRRQFLQIGGAAAVAAAVGGAPNLFAGELGGEERPQFRKAVKFGMIQTDGSLADKFKLLKRLGFDGVELPSPNRWSSAEVLRARDEANFTIHGVVDSTHWKKRLSDPDPSVRAAGADDLKTAIRDAQAYGGTSVLLVPGKVDAGATYEQAWERSHSEIRKAIPLAEDLEIRILFENVWNDFLVDPHETAKFIDQFGSKSVGAYFDVGNSVRYAPPIQWIRALGKRIVKLDIKEFSLSKAKEKGQYSGFEVALLEGDCNWPAVIAELRQIDFHGWGTAEIPGGGEERLRDVAERMDRIFRN